MFFINLYEIINSLDFTLEKNVKSYNNSFVDKFIDELREHLHLADSIKKLEKVPKDTLFTLDRYESNYAVCENRTTGEMYDIPKSMVDSSVREGKILKFENGKYRVDYEESIKQSKVIKELVEKVTKSKSN